MTATTVAEAVSLINKIKNNTLIISPHANSLYSLSIIIVIIISNKWKQSYVCSVHRTKFVYGLYVSLIKK